MRGKSHICLGQYLIKHYMPDLPRKHEQAFLLGCIEPDRNPATYLKGSLRCQWLRGHNYRNARRFIRRISLRLEGKRRLNTLDYYTLGKLIHYTADAFTYAHNADFPESLSDHREYEAALQTYFLRFMQDDPQVDIALTGSIMEGISRYHREYSQEAGNIRRDCRYALRACCCVLALLMTPRII
ncbi:MAG: zinc dependent phospholipase C family protein [Oscillospiraceae bacterium]|nr:zinc dependent phospholipase C family protein [Oscillospiraceae bacterium]MBQ7129500.1 zinc dependent phospholipase C family protein [Oscillospiraceae bacterium]